MAQLVRERQTVIVHLGRLEGMLDSYPMPDALPEAAPAKFETAPIVRAIPTPEEWAAQEADRRRERELVRGVAPLSPEAQAKYGAAVEEIRAKDKVVLSKRVTESTATIRRTHSARFRGRWVRSSRSMTSGTYDRHSNARVEGCNQPSAYRTEPVGEQLAPPLIF